MNDNSINIFFSLEEKDEGKDENKDINQPNIFELMNLLADDQYISIYDQCYYNEYTIKDLLKICNYYGIDKNIKLSKCKKQDIIFTLIYFESLPENTEIVQKRQESWRYITNLLNDLKMKKYIIWN